MPLFISVFMLLAATLFTGGVGVLKLYRLLGGRRFWLHALAGLFAALGAVPPAVLLALWYARAADYRWTIQGPFPFDSLGSGPFLLWISITTLIMASACWGVFIWLQVWAGVGSGYFS